MAQPMPNKAEDGYQEAPSGLSNTQPDRDGVSLYFPSEAIAMRTPFRDAALNFIYRAALELSDGRLESAEVSVWSHPDEEDSETLDLILVVDADWEFISKLRYEILVKLGEWSSEWSEERKRDYGRHIYFGFLPSTL